jgi:ATP-dependent DNA ligase
MVPFAPMLCKRQFFDIGLFDSLAGIKAAASAASTKGSKIMGGLDFLIEDKLDGERMLIHKRGDDVMVFSRRTNRYPEYAECLAPIIRTSLDCTSCILDGEMMAWDSTDERFVDFGANRVQCLSRFLLT